MVQGQGKGNGEVQRLQAEILRLKLRSSTEDERVRRYVTEMEHKRDRDVTMENERLKADLMASLEDLKSVNEQFLLSRSQLDFQLQLRQQERAKFEGKLNELQDSLNQAAWAVESQKHKPKMSPNEPSIHDGRVAPSQEFTAERARLRSNIVQLTTQNR
jgi:hypothetical protein